ncbi:MAG TPA: acyl-CoA dehydrogenase family protein [Ramlibacter sp.]|nr:acyl-CoA dehydrogenase family protein [Ramlibacter sp.]
MNFQYSESESAFRAEVRAVLQAHLPRDMAHRHALGFHPLPKADLLAWNRILADKGWAAPHWPVEYGGPGWTPIQRHIFEEECRHASAPDLSWQGLRLCGPVIYTFGSTEQKARFLPPILRGDYLLAQGFSEPNAGSDLASLKTSAVRDGDHYIVNGQKTWSSEGHYADWGFFLVRTDTMVKPQRGISFLMIDLRSPGVTVQPIRMFNGMHYVNEIFLENVRVPVENLVGEEGAGWRYAKFLLDNERTSSAFIHFSRHWLERTRAIARRQRSGGVLLAETPAFARRLAAVEIELQALEYSVLRVLTQESTAWDATAVASALKVRGSEIQQRVTELALDALGWQGLRSIEGFEDPLCAEQPDAEGWPADVAGVSSGMLQTRAVTIYGGAKEVQKNIIARLAFNL